MKILSSICIISSVLSSAIQATDIYCPQIITCNSNNQCDAPIPFDKYAPYGDKALAPGKYIFIYAMSEKWLDRVPTSGCLYIHPSFPQPLTRLFLSSSQNLQPDIQAPGDWVSDPSPDKDYNNLACSTRVTVACPFIIKSTNI